MNEKVKVIGVYHVEGYSDVHLIELEIWEKPSSIDMEEITQEIPNRERLDWQAPYDEHYLNTTGDKVIGDYFKLPVSDTQPTRLVFFMYFLDFDSPLLSQFGEIKLSSPTPMPERLKDIIVFEEVD